MQLTGVFTAPRSGDYQFNFQARVSAHFFSRLSFQCFHQPSQQTYQVFAHCTSFYRLVVNFFLQNKENNDAFGDMRLLKDGVTMTYSQMRKDYFTMFGTAILSLQAGNKVRKKMQGSPDARLNVCFKKPVTHLILKSCQMCNRFFETDFRFLFRLIFQFYLMYRLICQKPAHFLSAQMALVSTFFKMFIVLRMYNFDHLINTYLQISIQKLQKCNCSIAGPPTLYLHSYSFALLIILLLRQGICPCLCHSSMVSKSLQGSS